MVTVNMTAEEFGDFLRCLSNLKEVCTDADIKGGIIRQRSTDLTCIFEMDLSSLINEADIPITDLKKKLDLLKTFAGQAVTIDIDDESDDKKYKVSDEYSAIKFNFPTEQFMDNKYMDQEELDNIFNLDEDDLILHDEITQLITERIRVISENFNTASIQINFRGESASINAATQSKDQFATFKRDINTNMVIEDSVANLSTIPFGIEHDTDVEFKMYKDPSKNITLNKISTELGAVKINIYSRSAIIEDSDE
jgi:hypothetical protein